jgi:flavin-dependent dehydrogenase
MVLPTRDLDAAAGSPWQAVVVGAGPAGGLAAYELARRGVATLLVDRATFPRWKVCGACLNGSALATLEAAGLGTLVREQAAVPLRQVYLGAGGRAAAVALPGWVALSREALDAELVEAAIAAGAHFLSGARATLLRGASGYRRLLLRQGDRTAEITAQVVLAADGLGGRLLAGEGAFAVPAAATSRIGAGVIAEEAPSFYDTHSIYMACGAGGYVGLVRLEDGRLNLAAALAPALVRDQAGPGAAAAAILREAGWPPVPELEALSWRGTPGLTRRASRLTGERVFVLGDAAGYVEPFTGEGMAWALAAGTAVAPLAAQAVHCWEPALEQAWVNLYRQQVARRQLACRVAARVLRHPLLVRSLLAVLARAPGLAAPFVRHLNATAAWGR